MLGKNGFHIRIQHEKSYQNDEVFFLGFEKVLKVQASAINNFDFFSRSGIFCMLIDKAVSSNFFSLQKDLA